MSLSKVVEPEDHVKLLKRIIDNPEVLSPDLLVGPTDNYTELFGQLESKLVWIDFLQTVRDDHVDLFDI